MNYLEYSERLEHLHYMIRTERLRNLSDAARKYNCSKSTIKRMLEKLKLKGHKIKYCKKIKIFYEEN